MVTFSPHYVIVNLMSVPLMYRQSQAKLGIVKDPYANDDSGIKRKRNERRMRGRIRGEGRGDKEAMGEETGLQN